MMRKNTHFYTIIFSLLAALVTNAQARTMHAEFSAQSIPDIAGYRLYHENSLACEVNDPSATSIDCDVDIADGETWFTLTYFLENGIESAHSAPFTYVLSSTLQAAVTTNTVEGPAPLQVSFDASTSTGSISTYEWSFGDGNTSTGATADHIFSSPGNYSVTLVITDEDGATDLANVTITATDTSDSNKAPVAVISSSASIGNAPFLVTFDAGGSSDSDGTITSYQWDLGDGGTATGAQISHTYTVAGTYNPILTVTDNGGLTDSASTPVLVEPPISGNAPPTAIISASTTQGDAPLAITFSASNSSDSDGSISSYNWDFGDGSTGSGMIVSHSFAQPADYTVSLTVIDNTGAASQPATLNISAKDPSDQESPRNVDLLPIINLLLLDTGSN